MKSSILILGTSLFLFSCHKVTDAIVSQGTGEMAQGSFVKYTIAAGAQYCDQSVYRPVEVDEMKYVVRFDSSAIYQTVDPGNQEDINKLFGFSDNNMDHHQYSARIGWRWSNSALRLFGYVYNAGVVSSLELATIPIGADVHCSITVAGSQYIFTVGDMVKQLPRQAATPRAKGYRLYPFFGGDETAPHEIRIWMKEN
jgi:hypothetical protein